MTWPIAIFGCFCVMIAFIFLFLTIVYLKEYAREEKTIKEYMKLREQQAKEFASIMQGNPPQMYVMQPAKKKVAPPAPPKDKKNIN
jgi:hypothetical protein